MSIHHKRMLDAKIWESRQFNMLKPTERLLYIGMINHGDYEGRLRGDAEYLRKHFFYSDKIGTKKVVQMRDRITEVGLIEFYCDKDGEYISHPNWKRYQSFDKRWTKPSYFPAPPTCANEETATNPPVQENRSEEKITKDKTSEENEQIKSREETLHQYSPAEHMQKGMDEFHQSRKSMIEKMSM